MPGDTSIDARNADFWDELCGTTLARAIGITDRSPQSVARFDEAYLRMYPYLAGYLPADDLSGVRVLEVGLGFGTVGGLLVRRGAQYTGVDLAQGPVDMMRYRIELAGRTAASDARQASVLNLPFDQATFDFVCSIGCVHHTGDIARAVSELRRVVKPGGSAVVMVYNRWSARRLLRAPFDALARRRGRGDEGLRASYDSDTRGRPAPHTEFLSSRQARRLFENAGFRTVTVERRNLAVPRLPGVRRLALRLRLDWFLGLDLYVRAAL